MSFLRRTLPGEYLSLTLMVVATLGTTVWSFWVVRFQPSLLIMTAGIWAAVRAAGACSSRNFTPFVTAGLIASMLMLGQQELPASYLRIFSPHVFASMLGMVLLLDITERAMAPSSTSLGQRLRSWKWYRIAIWTFVASFLVYMVVIPTAVMLIQYWQPAKSSVMLEDLTLAEQIRQRSVEAIVALAFFVLGATIGSFLNVVVYRMPRGESVVLQRSRCPKCETQIKGRDNVPILGWLLLNGRCRACEAAISSRYPIVETIVASNFLLLYFVELISGGINLPVRTPNLYRGVVWIILYTKWDLVGLYLFHCFALCTLLVWALVDIDRQRIPWWARSGAGIVLCLLAALCPNLLPVPWSQRTLVFGFHFPEWLTAVTSSAAGGLVGSILAWIVSRTMEPAGSINTEVTTPVQPPRTAEKIARRHVVSAGMLAGMTVGWQAAIGIWLVTLALRPILLSVSRVVKELPLTAFLAMGYLIHLICWRLLHRIWWPSSVTAPLYWSVWCVGFATLLALNGLLKPHRKPDSPAGI